MIFGNVVRLGGCCRDEKFQMKVTDTGLMGWRWIGSPNDPYQSKDLFWARLDVLSAENSQNDTADLEEIQEFNKNESA